MNYLPPRGSSGLGLSITTDALEQSLVAKMGLDDIHMLLSFSPSVQSLMQHRMSVTDAPPIEYGCIFFTCETPWSEIDDSGPSRMEKFSLFLSPPFLDPTDFYCGTWGLMISSSSFPEFEWPNLQQASLPNDLTR
jgi:hypothetical protein